MSRALDACASLLRLHFGADVSCDVVPVDGDPTQLLRAEQELVTAAVPSRRREFAAGRVCARALLAQLGFDPRALLRADDRSPAWPHGSVGSIAHDGRWCAVAVARTERWSCLGLDIEPDEPLEDDLWHEIFTEREIATLRASAHSARENVARVLFSAKECVYKCTHSFVRPMLGFQDVEILLVPGSGRFQALLHHAAGVAVLEGFHITCAGSILTGMTLASSPRHLALRRTTAVSST